MDLEPAQRAAIYRLVSALLLHEVEGPLLALLRQPAVSATLEAAQPGVHDCLTGWNEAAQEAHAEEFTRLFLLPKGVPPRASAWLPQERDTLGAGIAREVTALLQELGREQNGLGGGRLPEDHGALLFELAACALEALPARGEAFSCAVLEPWVGAFGAGLTANASSPLYRALGSLLAGLHA